jgi:small subunit ribosomal protein S11
MARQPGKKSGSKKQKRNVPNGVAYISSTFNNTIITIADNNGDVISWSSSGASGFKGAKKGTPFAAQTASESAAKRAMDQLKSWSAALAPVERLLFALCKAQA